MLKLAEGRSGKKTCQIKSELDAFIELLHGHKTTRYLEIGARYGDTFFNVVSSLPKGSLGVCVDLPGSVWGSVTSKKHLLEACEELKIMGYEIRTIFGDSKSHEVITAVESLSLFDACLIDGDHTYNGVKTDFWSYQGFAKLVALHDIVGHGQRCKGGYNVEVPKFWQEIKNENSLEFIAPGSKMGIGVYA